MSKTITDQGGLITGVTLHVGGLLVTGTICSAAEFLLETGEQLANANAENTDDHGQSFRDAFESAADLADKAKANQPAFIHLRSAQYFLPGGHSIPTSGGILWRGRLDQVAGFNIGVVSKPK